LLYSLLIVVVGKNVSFSKKDALALEVLMVRVTGVRAHGNADLGCIPYF
jgi:hypothetical protein